MNENNKGIWTLYCHINKSNGKKYIGITSVNPNERWRNGRGYAKSPYFYHAIKKYGWNNFDHVIIFEGLTEQKACELEVRLIKKLKLQDPLFGYNFSDGGNSGNSLKGENHPMYGKHHTEEAKEKNRKAHVGKTFKMPQDAIEKIRLARLGTFYGKGTKVRCVETGDVYLTAADAQRSTGADASSIIKCIKGKMRQTHGLHWEAA